MVSINEQYSSIMQQIKRKIDEIEENELIRTNPTELADFFLKVDAFSLIERDKSRNIEIKKRKTPNYGVVLVDIYYPIFGGKTFLERARLQEVIAMSANTNFIDGHPSIKINGDWLEITTEGKENWIKQAIEDLEKVISWKNLDIKNGNEQLKNEISSYTIKRQGQIKKESDELESIAEKMSIPIIIRKSEIKPVIDFDVKAELVQLKPKPIENNQELALTSNQVALIIRYIKNSCLSFEKTPRVFSKLEEEDLRDIILGNLNAIFEGNATGETFSKSGKTDIHLSITQKNALIMECKFWNGTEKYSSALDQLFSYLTWRNNHAVLITFSRNKDCINVLKKAKESTLAHRSIVLNSLKESQLGEFVTLHRNPNASEKTLEVYHLIFDLYYQ